MKYYILLSLLSLNVYAYDGDVAQPWCLDPQGRVTYDMSNCMGNGKLTEADKANLDYAKLQIELDTARYIAFEQAQAILRSNQGNGNTQTMINEPNTNVTSGSGSVANSQSNPKIGVTNSLSNSNTSVLNNSNSSANINNNRIRNRK